MSGIGMFAGLAALAGIAVEPDGYAACLDSDAPLECIADLAVRNAPDTEFTDVVAAGAPRAVLSVATPRQSRVAELAARVALGERPGLSPAEAQTILALFGGVEFYESGLPGDARAQWLWPVALSAPVHGLDLREGLLIAASRAERDDEIRTLIREAPLGGDWAADERASFASSAARLGRDWRAAEAWLASGGERAGGYSIPEIRLGIDQARLHESYDPDAAARVLEGILSDDGLLPWPMDGPEALKAAGATGELRALGVALVARGRTPGRRAEDRTDDFGLAAWAFRAIGDEDAALSAAREGMAFVPEAVVGRSNVSSFGTWPVRELLELAPDEAVMSGLLWSYDRYAAVVKAGGQGHPSWIVDDASPFSVVLATDLLRTRRDAAAARALFEALEAKLSDPGIEPWDRIESADNRMMLAAVAGDGEALNDVFADAVAALDEGEAGAGEALRLVIDYREAREFLTSRP
ncbi:MAG: hypothetical protein KJ703_01845 [Alphaproteobacteria bacterium]|nr:hypothetical protein [Alphaproteobacteria bacterium]MBU1755727.1 hypothetical protein [Alphaproteobacteria bacterium]MBU2271381.1 hypothetical protein [Alphaproteobacteria bacterium]MBU2417941.1 hypothetical protein [Alphaproteobacteria bacterium]